MAKADNLAGQVYITGQTRSFGASSIPLRRFRATSTAEKSGPSTENRGGYHAVSFACEKRVQSGKTAAPWGAVVECGAGGPALSTDSISACFCLSPSAQESPDDTARSNPIQSTRMRTSLLPRNLHHLPGLRAKIRLQPQEQAAGRFLGRP